VIDLYYRVKVGTRVVVLRGSPPANAQVAPTPGPGIANTGPVMQQGGPRPPMYSQPQYSQQQPEPYAGEPVPLQPPAVIPAR
jgi:hypothetical protein